MRAHKETTRGIGRTAWQYALRRSWHGFVRHRGIDSAAALTFFAALATFPASLAVVSSLAIVNDRKGAVVDLLNAINTVARESTVSMLAEPIAQFTRILDAGWALAAGIALTIWSASAYATACGRAVNVAYEMEEGRPFWKFRGLMLLLSVPLVIAFSLIVAILLLTPRVVTALGQSLGFGAPWIDIWGISKWVLLAIIAILMIAALYYFTPNVARPRFRWVSWGALIALIGWIVATIGFAAYAANISSYDRIYGWLGGAIALLLWLYLSNLVLVFGAEVDSELVRVRQLRAGIRAEDAVALPPRDSTRIRLLNRMRAKDEADGHALREGSLGENASHEEPSNDADSASDEPAVKP